MHGTISDALESAIIELRSHQTQLDMDGVMVGVSRQALEEVLDALSRSTLPREGQGEVVVNMTYRHPHHYAMSAAIIIGIAIVAAGSVLKLMGVM